ncbi:MAG: acetyltransferase [Flavobacteriaceae bacterium]|nr:acetyltransferase [Flavobacteriaceae bacterium]MDZ4147726.1 acetyltransferase [Flavobacteriaceae bacterium]
MENSVFLFGASGHCKVVLDILLQNSFFPKAIFDDAPEEKFLWNIPILKSDKLPINSTDSFFISIGNNLSRKKISEKFKLNYISLVHPKAVVSVKSTMGEGTIVMANAVLNPDAQIGRHCIINTGAVIEHDCKLADFIHVSPNASLAGNVTVGEGTHIGIGAAVIQGIKIGRWATVGAGAVILEDVPDFAVVVGVPGKIIRFNSF